MESIEQITKTIENSSLSYHDKYLLENIYTKAYNNLEDNLNKGKILISFYIDSNVIEDSILLYIFGIYIDHIKLDIPYYKTIVSLPITLFNSSTIKKNIEHYIKVINNDKNKLVLKK